MNNFEPPIEDKILISDSATSKPDGESLTSAQYDQLNEMMHRVDTIRESDWDNFYKALNGRQKQRLEDAAINDPNNTNLRYNLLFWADGNNLRDTLSSGDKEFIKEMINKLPKSFGSDYRYVGIHNFEAAIRLWDELQKYKD